MFNILKHPEDGKEVTTSGANLGNFRKKLRWHIGQSRHAEFWTISPAAAAELIKLNTDEDYRNRPPNAQTIGRYARAMKEGRWMLTGEPLIISGDGVLLNGQHRLYGCIESGCVFETLIVFGIERAHFKFMDRGLKRTAAHVFAIEGVQNATLMAAAMQWVYRITEHGGWNGTPSERLENEQLLRLYYQNESLQQSAWVSHAINKEGEHLTSNALLTALHYLFAAKNRKMADEFVSKVVTGVGVASANEPEHKIRKWLAADNKESGGRTNETYRAAYIVMAWNARRNNKPIKIFRWRTEQTPTASFPVIR